MNQFYDLQNQDIQESVDEVGRIGEYWHYHEEVMPDGSLIKCGAYEKLCFPCWIVDCVDVSKIQQFRDIGVDFLLSMLDEDSEYSWKIEVKTCREAYKTQNMAIEIYSNTVSKYPGWYLKTKCDILIYYMLDQANRDNDQVLIVPMRMQRVYVEASKKAGKYSYCITKPDKRTKKRNQLYCVDIFDILENIPGAFVIPAVGEYDYRKLNLLQQKGMLSD